MYSKLLKETENYDEYKIMMYNKKNQHIGDEEIQRITYFESKLKL